MDEGDDPAVRAAAARYAVRYFTRRGHARYNDDRPPFVAKTKAGNVNAWLHAHGHAYDVFVQLDIDHRPRPDYLDHVLGYFRDPQVAWVQAPSLYGNRNTWVARGAAEQELVLQGPLQQGFFGHSETPFIIGSHCTYRTRAVLEIEGFQPTRAEDHLDTVVLAARGYRGVYVPQAIALGSGPETFETYLRQQFAWALSMVQVLLRFTPRLVWRYRPAQAIQFLFAQSWYPLWSASMLTLFALPLLALARGQSPAHAALPEFVLRSAPLGLVAFGVWRWSRPWQLPAGLGLSWRGVVLHVARWPIVCWAVLNAALGIRHPYMITPKGERAGLPRFPLRSQAIYLAGVWASL
ncbi:MAG TPA: glycosyltransferase family 2 protein, partial [Vicinamibacteria bacterium]|nr:glycosyltransferase family 2 protein [Vicinamibacteria bacterium]